MLSDYLPEFIRELKEMKVIMSVEDDILKNSEGGGLDSAVKSIFKDQYIETASENGVKKYENMLKILSRESERLDVRKFKIFMKFNEKLPYTLPKLKEQLDLLCGKGEYAVYVDIENFILTVKISLKSKGMLAEAACMLERMTPLNMVIDLDLIYNAHLTVGNFKHGFLHKYTHKGVRDEVLK